MMMMMMMMMTVLFPCCRDDDMQSIASLITPDTSYDVGNMDDIDNDDYDADDADDDDNADNDQGISSVADSDSNLTISELTSQIEGTFSCDSSAHGRLLKTCSNCTTDCTGSCIIWKLQKRKL